MASYQCSAVNFYPTDDPRWLGQFRGHMHESKIERIGERAHMRIGERLFSAKDCPLPADTPVVVHLSASGFFYCESIEEMRLRLEQEREQELLQKQKQSLESLKVRQEALEFNARIQLPVAWCAGHKTVLSGLSETSIGNGRNKASVEHILLEEDLSAGRLKRKAGSFLCTSPSGSDGFLYGTPKSLCADEHGLPYSPKITCKNCIAAASRWIKNT